MKRDRIAEVHYYEWRIGAWAISETRDRLDATGRGIYRELLDHCYGQGRIPDDKEWMCRRCACTVEELAKTWKVISRHFPKIAKTGYRSNVYADIFRTEYFRYVQTQQKNRSSKSNKSNEIYDDGATIVRPSFDDGRTNDTIHNGNVNGNVDRTATSANLADSPTDRWGDEERAIGRWLTEYPGAQALTGVPDLQIVRACMEHGSVDQIRTALRDLGIARKAPARSWAWFPVAIASKLRGKQA